MTTTAKPLRLGITCSNCLRRRIAATTITTTGHHLSRAFTASVTRRKHGSVAVFTPTSSPELDALLSTFRTQVFIPAHLPKAQVSLLYKQKYKSMLEADPFYVDVGEEKVQLSHIVQVRDEPNTRKGFDRMLALMKERRDWENLPALLEELRNAKRHHVSLQKAVRRANEAGMQHVVVECAKRGARTGLVLRPLDIVREVMWGAHLCGQQGGWDERAAAKALHQAEYVVLLLENPLHCGDLTADVADARMQPDIVGVLLETAAIYALKHQDGQDRDGKVAQYAERLMGCWRNATFDSIDGENRSSAGSDGDAGSQAQEKAWWVANSELQRWAPVWKGMEVAARILDPKTQVAAWLRRTLPVVEKVLNRAREVVEGSLVGKPDIKRRGLEWYDGLKKI